MVEQFNKFADVLPADFNTAENKPGGPNPFGFGYKYPDRVKLQYIAVPRELVRQAVRSAPPPRAAAASRARRSRRRTSIIFGKSRPTATTATTSRPSPQRRPPPRKLRRRRRRRSQRPSRTPKCATWRCSVLDPEVDRLVNVIQGRITSALSGGWQTYRARPAAPAVPHRRKLRRRARDHDHREYHDRRRLRELRFPEEPGPKSSAT